jgi:hypothetical protein
MALVEGGLVRGLRNSELSLRFRLGTRTRARRCLAHGAVQLDRMCAALDSLRGDPTVIVSRGNAK